MKKSLALALVLLSVSVSLFGVEGFAASKKAHAKKDDGKPQLGTSFKLSRMTMRGKYNTTLGASAKVEDDKYLEDLLGGRKQFEDRMQKETERN